MQFSTIQFVVTAVFEKDKANHIFCTLAHAHKKSPSCCRLSRLIKP